MVRAVSLFKAAAVDRLSFPLSVLSPPCPATFTSPIVETGAQTLCRSLIVHYRSSLFPFADPPS